MEFLLFAAGVATGFVLMFAADWVADRLTKRIIEQAALGTDKKLDK